MNNKEFVKRECEKEKKSIFRRNDIYLQRTEFSDFLFFLLCNNLKTLNGII